MNIPRNPNQLHYWYQPDKEHAIEGNQNFGLPGIADDLDYLSEDVLVYCAMQINNEVQGVFGIGYCTPKGDWYVSTIDGIYTSSSARFTVLMWRYLDDPPCVLVDIQSLYTRLKIK